MSQLPIRSGRALLPLRLRWAARALLLGLLAGSFETAQAAATKGAQMESLASYVQAVVNSSNGLPQDSVRAIVQGANNFVWFGTEEGLARYDGVHAVTYDRNNTPAIRENMIRALAAAPDGRIWVATQSGVSRFDNGRVLSSIPVRDTNTLFCDAAGQLWIGTDHGLFTTKDLGRSLQTVAQVQPGVAVRAIAGRTTDDLWLLIDAGVLRLRNGQAHLLGQQDGLPEASYTAVLVAADGTLWIAGRDKLFHWKDRVLETVPFAGLGDHPAVTALLQDKAGSVWVGFAHDGVARLQDGQLLRYTVRNGLPSNEVAVLKNDRSGNIWVGLAQGGGVSLHEGLFRTIGEREGLADSMVWTTLAARDGSIWVGTNTKGIEHILASGEVEHFNRARGIPPGSVLALFEDTDASIWAGLDSGDLVHMTAGHVRVFPSPSPYSGALRSIVRGPGGDLYLFYRKSGSMARLHNGQLLPEKDPPSGPATFVATAPDNSLWIGSDQSGVTHWNGHVLEHFGAEQGLPAEDVTYLAVEPSGMVWVATTGGLALIRDGKLTLFSPQNGLFSYTVGTVLDDGNGYLWMSSNKGLSKIRRQELLDFADGRIQSVHGLVYGSAEGMRTPECNYSTSPSASRAPDGRLWFSTPAGAVSIDPKHSVPSAGLPQARIEAIAVDGRAVSLDAPILLSKGTHDLQADFTAPDFIAANHLRFRYRLEGFDKTWVDAGSRRQAFYTHLPPGEYMLLMQAEDGRGWPQHTTSLAITIPPHFWQTNWFWLVCTLASIAAAFGMYNIRVYSLRRRGTILQDCITRRTKELENAIRIAEAAQQQLREQATRDSLTRLWNRRHIVEILQNEAGSSDKDRRNLCVLMLDVDHFKHINDTAGHLGGDHVLQQVGQVLVERTLPCDHAGRYGGEEFLLVLRNCTLEAGLERSEIIRAAIESMRVVYDGKLIPVTASCGVAELKRGNNVEAALKQADAALYRAKQTGRNRVCTVADCSSTDVALWFDPSCGYAV